MVCGPICMGGLYFCGGLSPSIALCAIDPPWKGDEGQRTAATDASSTFGMISALPAPRQRMKRRPPAAAFLSRRMRATQGGGRQTRGHRDRQAETRQQTFQVRRVRIARQAQVRRQPRGQHHADRDRLAVVASRRSPARSRSRGAKVWPKLSSARSPRSNGSRATISALCAQLRAMASASASASRASRASACASSQSRKPRIADRAVLHHFGQAGAQLAIAAACAASRCRRTPRAADGMRRPGSCPAAGRPRSCRRPRNRPSPAASSAIARNRCRASSMRRRSPARSPTTPPPSAITHASRVAPKSASSRTSSPKRVQRLRRFAGGDARHVATQVGARGLQRIRHARRIQAARHARRSRATHGGRARVRASAAPSRSRPAPIAMR